MLPWNAAAWRQSTYEPRVRKVHGPVGEPLVSPWNETAHDSLQRHACKDCGYHVCSCAIPLGSLPSHEDMAAFEGFAPPAKPEPREYSFKPLEECCSDRCVANGRERCRYVVVPPHPGPAGPVVVDCPGHCEFAHCRACEEYCAGIKHSYSRCGLPRARECPRIAADKRLREIG